MAKYDTKALPQTYSQQDILTHSTRLDYELLFDFYGLSEKKIKFEKKKTSLIIIQGRSLSLRDRIRCVCFCM